MRSLRLRLSDKASRLSSSRTAPTSASVKPNISTVSSSGATASSNVAARSATMRARSCLRSSTVVTPSALPVLVIVFSTSSTARADDATAAVPSLGSASSTVSASMATGGDALTSSVAGAPPAVHHRAAATPRADLAVTMASSLPPLRDAGSFLLAIDAAAAYWDTTLSVIPAAASAPEPPPQARTNEFDARAALVTCAYPNVYLSGRSLASSALHATHPVVDMENDVCIATPEVGVAATDPPAGAAGLTTATSANDVMRLSPRRPASNADDKRKPYVAPAGSAAASRRIVGCATGDTNTTAARADRSSVGATHAACAATAGAADSSVHDTTGTSGSLVSAMTPCVRPSTSPTMETEDEPGRTTTVAGPSMAVVGTRAASTTTSTVAVP
mmetsp:Transcript_2642/g.9173  ORF Transcript_2642/g.9173 Transcript_2642/m.9173 type:complete len:389 (+) Transcript_2642:4837-6003(+)